MSPLNFAVACAVLFFVQSSFLPYFLPGQLFDLWLVVIVIGAVIIAPKDAFLLAAAGGFIQDIVAGNFFGIHLVPYLIITFIYVKLGKEKYNKHWYISLIAVVIASVLAFLSEGMVLYLSGNSIFLTFSVVERLFSFTLWNGIFALLIHNILWAVKREGEPRW